VRLEREGHVRLNFRFSEIATGTKGESYFLPFAEGGFRTASGKAELYSGQLAKLGLDPVATFVPPLESRHSLLQPARAERQHPLELLSRKCDNFLNSTFANLPPHQKMETSDRLEISSADAEERGIRDGDRVRVYNDRGEIELRACVTGAVQSGVVAARLAWAKLAPGGHNVNALTSDRLTDMGGGPTFYSTLVQVERI
jgi:anaerobic selenocysteine-containing dehydrogenase